MHVGNIFVDKVTLRCSGMILVFLLVDGHHDKMYRLVDKKPASFGSFGIHVAVDEAAKTLMHCCVQSLLENATHNLASDVLD